MALTQSEIVAWCTRLIEESPDFPSLEVCLNAIPALDALAGLPAGTRILVRGDTDVVVEDNGEINDDIRLQSMLETLKFGAERGWVQIVYGHRGRDPELSLEPVARHLQKLLRQQGLTNQDVYFVGEWMDDSSGAILDSAAQSIAKLPQGAIVVLENTRRYKLEQTLWKVKSGDLNKLGERLTRYANEMRDKFAAVHVNEGFASSNRDLSSTVVPVAMERRALGKYIDRELKEHVTRTRLAELVIFSGLKINKLDDLQAILHRKQTRMVIAAGSLAMALKKAAADLDGQVFEMGAAGDTAKSDSKIYIPPDRIEQAKRMMQFARANGVEFVLPVDFILADGQSSDTIPPGGAQFDVGPKTIALQASKIGEFIAYHQQKQSSGKGPAVVFYNGVFGMFEKPEFALGTQKFIEQLKRLHSEGVQVYVGGGEGGAALLRYGDESWVTHLFTAGGTILKALGTEPIPYIKALYLASQR